ncbi:MAG: hypothetical protein J6J42_10800 [Lachnospiraceae bacterium]|nr:hypothetical protein [Lachnospiraceae bacterium]
MNEGIDRKREELFEEYRNLTDPRQLRFQLHSLDDYEQLKKVTAARIIQFLMIHGKGTVKEMKGKLSDVPTPSLYRHVKILADNSVIIVAEENRIRGTIESVYQLNEKPLSIEDDNGLAIQTSIMSICTSFAKYFASGNANPRKDLYMMTGVTLMLTDEEFKKFFTEAYEVAMKYMSKEPDEGRRARQISIISSPCE